MNVREHRSANADLLCDTSYNSALRRGRAAIRRCGCVGLLKDSRGGHPGSEPREVHESLGVRHSFARCQQPG